MMIPPYMLLYGIAPAFGRRTSGGKSAKLAETEWYSQKGEEAGIATEFGTEEKVTGVS